MFDQTIEKIESTQRHLPSAVITLIVIGWLMGVWLFCAEKFEYSGWEYTGMDLDEEEEDLAAENEQNEEEAEEEEEEVTVADVVFSCLSCHRPAILKYC